ncbi:mechanosensitive ion channel family protein [Crocosphaera chwakensis]|uniref:Putative mechanosensitive ion channel, MscS family protein n=1 Tax=Crocosphaera chwakensis CCY0110 TaxID=391612 RepID=A3IR56_9CHRO|nr:mechanosensitive ion channel family protein [Crocosphaera chwakensis]EAZ91046.1 putative mechanosensitive ion channel, MscS family protein [Crocosphaera chwakensis CCY0110]
MFTKKFKYIIILCLSSLLTLTSVKPSFGQISLFSPSTNSQPAQTAPWDLNKAYICGRFWCSDVYIHDDSKQVRKAILIPELTLATLQTIDQNNFEAIHALEQRAKLVQQSFKKIVNRIISSQKNSAATDINDIQFWIPTSVKALWEPAETKPPHPWLPKIEIGIKNQQTVIYAPDQFELGTSSLLIVTVTENDAIANNVTVEELALIWQENIINSFNNALWGHEFDQKYFAGRWIISAISILIAIISIRLVEFLRSFLRQRSNYLKKKLNKLTETLARNSKAIGSRQTYSDDSNHNSQEIDNETSRENKSQKNSFNFQFLVTKILNIIKKITKKNRWLSSKLSRSKQKLFLQRQNWFKQRINFYQLLLRLSLILDVFILGCCLIVISLVFRDIRFLSVYILKRTILLIIVWMGLTILDKVGDFLIDYYLNRWATEAHQTNPESNRYTLRINTYSTTLKQATSFISIVLGIYLTIWLVGIDTTVLAGAGIVAVAVAFLSRNLLEDMLNGVLILWSDRYAIGDVIDVNGMGGFVESINLFVTSLRNLDGQLIAIPNSQISTVINHTKDWSRVNFTIKIAWYEDIKKAIDIMINVAKEMQNEPQWSDKFLEPLEVLGVDDVSHEGILIRVLIRTKPLEHWPLGREFRLRVKQDFDEANISLGIPHHTISVINDAQNDDQLLSYNIPRKNS